MSWDPETSCGFESRKIKYLLPRYTRGQGLDIGCGMEKAFPHFIGIDNGHHFGTLAADVVAEADDLSFCAAASQDFVFSSHVLEHMVDMEKTLTEWGRVLKPGGFLCLYVPDEDVYPKVGEPGANPDHKFNLNYDVVLGCMKNTHCLWDLKVFEKRNQGNEYSLFFVFRKI